MFDDFANKLLGDGSVSDKDRPENIKRLLNFFPVIGEDEHGTMTPLDATQVLTIPRTILATEVVKRGFMSNLLFANISGLFALPKEIVDGILSELPVERQGKKDTSAPTVDLTGIEVDEGGNVVVPPETVINKRNELFGDKVYDISPVTDAIEKSFADVPSKSHVPQNVTAKIVDVAMDLAKPIIVDTVKTGFELTNAQADKIEKRLKDYDYGMMICQENGRPIMTEHLNKRFQRVLNEMGIKPKHGEKQYVFHSIRSTATTYKLRVSGGDIKAVQGENGQKDPKMVTHQYSRIIDEDRIRIANAMNDDFYRKDERKSEEEELLSAVKNNPELFKQFVAFMSMTKNSANNLA